MLFGRVTNLLNERILKQASIGGSRCRPTAFVVRFLAAFFRQFCEPPFFRNCSLRSRNLKKYQASYCRRVTPRRRYEQLTLARRRGVARRLLRLIFGSIIWFFRNFSGYYQLSLPGQRDVHTLAIKFHEEPTF